MDKPKNKVNHLVVDSGAFILNSSIYDIGENIYSVDEVVDEIKDANTRSRLQVLPYDIKFRQPSDDDIKFVANFARKTGDFLELSSTDLKLIALTYSLEKEINGTAHLRQEPVAARVIGYGRRTEEKEEKKADKADEAEDNEADEDDEDDGWITSENIDEVKKRILGIKIEDEKDETLAVACITGDFAMQNVLMQIGLKVVNPKDGLCIKEAKTFVLRCYACFKVNLKNKSNQFCSFCGNFRTLKRVAVVTKDDGSKVLLINYKKPINIRGTRFSIPTPRGGKHAVNPVLTADQPMPQQRKSRMSLNEKKQMNVEKILNDPDYVMRQNPFAINDVYSKSSRFRTEFRIAKNPNQVRNVTGNRKKKSK